jgi:hypothetical protein
MLKPQMWNFIILLNNPGHPSSRVVTGDYCATANGTAFDIEQMTYKI